MQTPELVFQVSWRNVLMVNDFDGGYCVDPLGRARLQPPG